MIKYVFCFVFSFPFFPPPPPPPSPAAAEYTMGLFQTADREMAKSKMGEEEASLNKKQKKEIQVGRCDIDNGDGTVDLIKQDLRVSGTRLGAEETEDRKQAAMKTIMDDQQQDINDPRVLGTRLGGTVKKTVDDQQQDINDPRVLGTRLNGTTMTDDMVKEIIAKVQECGSTMTSDQLLKVIKGNQGEDGRVKKYKDEGAGLGGMMKGGGAGLDVTVKGVGTGRDHYSEDIDTSHSYPLAVPRLVEAP